MEVVNNRGDGHRLAHGHCLARLMVGSELYRCELGATPHNDGLHVNRDAQATWTGAPYIAGTESELRNARTQRTLSRMDEAEHLFRMILQESQNKMWDECTKPAFEEMLLIIDARIGALEETRP